MIREGDKVLTEIKHFSALRNIFFSTKIETVVLKMTFDGKYCKIRLGWFGSRWVEADSLCLIEHKKAGK